MKRIFLFIIGFFAIYLLLVIAINVIPTTTPKTVENSPEIQVQPQESASPSAKTQPQSPIAPDL